MFDAALVLLSGSQCPTSAAGSTVATVEFIPSYAIVCRCLDPRLLPSYFVIAPISSSYLTRQRGTQGAWSRARLSLLFEEYMDGDKPITGPSGLRHESAQSDRDLGSEPESSSGSDEDDQEQVQLQPAENGIEGNF